MTISASIGESHAPEGREAGREAARQALDKLGQTAPVFAWLMVSHTYLTADVVTGVAEVFGNLPMLGFSTSRELTSAGRTRRSVTVALLGGTGFRARSGWWGEYVQDTRQAVQHMLRSLHPDAQTQETLLLVADGFNGDADALIRLMSQGGCAVAGCLSGGEVSRGRTFQIGGRNSGSRSLSAAVLSGDVIVGQGFAHGWAPVGAVARISRVQNGWVRSIDNQPPGELYARLFGSQPRDWLYPPLNDLVRLYPLGVQQEGSLVVRSPLHMEADGSLRMNALLSEGQRVEMLIGSPDRCRQAAADAARQALQALGPSRPRLAILLVDAAWHSLMELEPLAEIEAVQSVIGAGVPIAGGYTFGQITRTSSSEKVRLYNQHILVLLFGNRNPDLDSEV